MKRNELSIIIGGYAGQGAKTVGDIFVRVCSRAGLYVFINQEYPSNIKGEHTYSHIMISENPISSHIRSIDLLLALDARTIQQHKDKVFSGGALIFDREGLAVSQLDVGMERLNVDRNDILMIDIPFKQIVREVGGPSQMINTIGLGAVQGLLKLDFQLLADVLQQVFSKYGDNIVQKNLEGARKAYDITSGTYSKQFDIIFEKRKAPNRMLLTGNDAVAMGAIKAGVKFYSGYPMTPSSSILNYMSQHAQDFDIVTVLAEDEISAAGMAIGASFAGARAMTGTSGGGFCLMSEHFGLAGMIETPLVIFEGQRPGPATGLPTRTEQGDLKFVLSAHQGDFPRIVVAPSDVEEAFYLTFDAFNLADHYQTPVIVLSDKHLAESTWTAIPFDVNDLNIDRGQILEEEDLSKIKSYKRFQITDSGISPRVRLGTPGGVFKASGNEHNEYGYISEDANNRKHQVEKRLRKISSLDLSEVGVKHHGDPNAEVTLVGWGSTKPVILDAMSELQEKKNQRFNFLQLIYIEPFSTDQVKHILSNAKRKILIENNATAQLGDIIMQKTGVSIDHKILQYNGRQFFRDELAELIEQYL